MIHKKYYDLLEVQKITGIEPIAFGQNINDFELYCYFEENRVGKKASEALDGLKQKVSEAHNFYLEYALNNRDEFSSYDEAVEWVKNKTFESIENAEIVENDGQKELVKTMSNTPEGYEKILVCDAFTDRMKVYGYESCWGEFVIDEYEVTYEKVFVTNSELERIKGIVASQNSQTNARATKQTPSKTSLKIIGLFMQHLAESEEYQNQQGSPNKSKIKDFLLELADDQNISTHGLSSSDDGILTDALRYLIEQKSK